MDGDVNPEPSIASHECGDCRKTFGTAKGLKIHQRSCARTTSNANTAKAVDGPSGNIVKEPTVRYKWGIFTDSVFERNLNTAYEKVVFWRQNLFMLPSGKAGKKYINENIRLLNALVEDSPLKEIAFKVIAVMPALLLQKPCKKSKSKDHVSA